MKLVSFCILLFSLSSFANDNAEFYKARYPLESLDQKLIDNHGDGFDLLYGTRNFRAVIPGIVYRGGANNKWHKTNPLPNSNPLQADGLANLCKEGFSNAVYLYSTNYDPKSKHNICESFAKKSHPLTYHQYSPSNSETAYEILKLVHESIVNSDKGPIYLHCWNGWHASGEISALVLRQFCDMPVADALAYWDRNTDGWNDEPQFERIRNRIRNFQAYTELKLSKDLQTKVCL